MIRIFVGLKVRLLRNTLRGHGGQGLVLFTFFAFMAGGTTAILVWRADAEVLPDAATAGAGVLVLGWALAPLLFGASDETIDTTRLALFPLAPRPLAAGLATAALVGPGPVAASLPLLAFALRAPTVASALVAVMAAASTLVLAVSISRWLLTGLGARLRRRRSRDLATVLAGVGAAVFGLGLQVVSRVGTGVGADQIATVARWMRMTPVGWQGDALGRATEGQVMVPLLELAAVGVVIALVARQWIRTLIGALAETDDGASVHDLGRDLLPAGGPLASRKPVMAAVAAKERRYLLRHPRYRVQIVSQATVLLVGGAPFLSAVLARNPDAVLMGCIPGLTAGVTGSNLLGTDGRALWGEAVALPSLRAVLRGRSLAFVTIGLGAAAFLTLAVAAWTGGWRFVPVALGAAVGMAFAGAGVGSYTSTVAPSLFPDDTSPNPFATTSPGGGCLNGIATFVGVLIGLASALPILAGLAAAREDMTAGLLLMVAAPVYGFGLWLLITGRAARRVDRKLPDLLLTLSSG